MSTPRLNRPDEEEKQLRQERQKVEDQLAFFVMNAKNTAANTAVSMRGYISQLLQYSGSPFFTVEFDETGTAHFTNQQGTFLGNHRRKSLDTVPEYQAIQNPLLKTKETYINKQFQEEVAKYKDLYLPKRTEADTKRYQNVIENKSILNSSGNFVIMENPTTGKIEFRYHPGTHLNLNNTHHAHLALGWPVLAAGDAIFENGKLELVIPEIFAKLDMPVDDQGHIKVNIKIENKPSMIDKSGGYNAVDSKMISYSTGEIIKEACGSKVEERPPLTDEQRDRSVNAVLSALRVVGVPEGVHIKLEGSASHQDSFTVTKPPLKDAVKPASTAEISRPSYTQASPKSAPLLSSRSRTPSRNKHTRKKTGAHSPLASVPENKDLKKQSILPSQMESAVDKRVLLLRENKNERKLTVQTSNISERSSSPQRSELESPASNVSQTSPGSSIKFFYKREDQSPSPIFLSFSPSHSSAASSSPTPHSGARISDVKVSQTTPSVEVKSVIQDNPATTAIHIAISTARAAANVTALPNVSLIGTASPAKASEQKAEDSSKRAKKKWRWPWSRPQISPEPNPSSEREPGQNTPKKRRTPT